MPGQPTCYSAAVVGVAEPAISRPIEVPRLAPTELLDSVRGAAATYVLLGHARAWLVLSATAIVGIQGGAAVLAHVERLFGFGQVAVLAFFLVSGYAIHYRQAFRLVEGAAPLISWRTYAWHRLRRLYPPLAAALLLTLVLDRLGAHLDPRFYAGNFAAQLSDGLVIGPHSWPTLLGTLLFVQGLITPLYGTDSSLWSLAFEGFYYLTYPVTLAFNRRYGSLRCLGLFSALAIGAVVIGQVLVLLGGSFGRGALGMSIALLTVVAYWPIWIAGTLIADARAGRVRIAQHTWNLGAFGGAAGLLVLIAFVVRTRLPLSGPFYFDALWSFALFWMLGWLVANRHAERMLHRLVVFLRPLQSLGGMSYSLYVTHAPVLVLISAVWLAHYTTLPATPWLALLGAAAAMAVALAVYWIAERPVVTRHSHRVLPVVTVDLAPSLDPGLGSLTESAHDRGTLHL